METESLMNQLQESVPRVENQVEEQTDGKEEIYLQYLKYKKNAVWEIYYVLR